MNRRLLLCLFLATGLAAPAGAKLGDTLDELRHLFGRPQGEPNKHTAFWMFDHTAGSMLYTVTFNEHGRSIAEGLKPHRSDRLTEQDADAFIGLQFTGRDGATRRTLKPGEAYQFAGQAFTCGPQESVVVDETNGILVIWNQARPPSLMAVSPELVRQTR